jgi:hypothetical protein
MDDEETFLLVPRLLTLTFDLVLKKTLYLNYMFRTKCVKALILEI